MQDFQELNETKDTLYKSRTLSNHQLNFFSSRGGCIRDEDRVLYVPSWGSVTGMEGGGGMLMI